MYNLLKPVLKAVGGRLMVVITPMPRYLKTRCCEDTDHLTNFREDDYGPGMKTKLDELRVNVGTFLFTDNIRRAAVINPAPIMEKMEQAEVWGEDPVHPKAELYKKLASMALCSLEKASEKDVNQLASVSGMRPRGPEWRSQESWNYFPSGWRGRGGYRGGRGRGYSEAYGREGQRS